MVGLMPQEVPSAVCFDTKATQEERHEYATPSLGSSRAGLGLVLLGMTLPQLKVGLSLFDFLEKVVQCLASWAVEP